MRKTNNNQLYDRSGDVRTQQAAISRNADKAGFFAYFARWLVWDPHAAPACRGAVNIRTKALCVFATSKPGPGAQQSTKRPVFGGQASPSLMQGYIKPLLLQESRRISRVPSLPSGDNLLHLQFNDTPRRNDPSDHHICIDQTLRTDETARAGDAIAAQRRPISDDSPNLCRPVDHSARRGRRE